MTDGVGDRVRLDEAGAVPELEVESDLVGIAIGVDDGALVGGIRVSNYQIHY